MKAMFERILIANRGEIAVRIIRACKESGIETVAVYSQADENSLHVYLADDSICIGPPPSSESYLNIPAIISAAEIGDVDAIHPGYGFLAENPRFAEACEGAGFVFIGPPSEAIERMGDKALARETMRRAGVPVVPGAEGTVSDEQEALEVAESIGLPVMIKAAAGGGGRGMRIVRDREEVPSAFMTAQEEAQSAFGNPAMYIEKFVEAAHHIEVQILADKYGNVLHLGERDCSIQRRHQKLIEEAPSPVVTPEIRKRICGIATKAAQAVEYVNAGTVEFIMDAERNFYFMEMNTRVQVEHPVTEMITGVDIVKHQISIAAGEQLRIAQEEIDLNGHAIECRINAEDPQRSFLPDPGRIEEYHPPGGPGVRWDSHVYWGYTVPLYYDSLLGKLVVHGDSRNEAVSRMKRALQELAINGLSTTVPFHLDVMDHPSFREGSFCTDFVEREFRLGQESIESWEGLRVWESSERSEDVVVGASG